MAYHDILFDVAGGVATITLNRPERRNALRGQTLGELSDALAAARNDQSVRAVLLTGQGDAAFCAGADLGEFVQPGSKLVQGFGEVFLAIEQLGKPIVGAINGHALAGGFGLALSCDLLITSDTATFGTPEIRVGVWPMMIMSIIARNIGRKRALHLFMTGERVDAATALEWGAVNRVVAQPEVMPAARALAEQLATWSPAVMHLGRQAFYEMDGMDFEPALRYLQQQLEVVAATNDFKEGVAAFLEKREPRFTGS